MAANCEYCPLYTQCNNAYNRLADYVAIAARNSEIYHSEAVSQHLHDIEQRIEHGLDLSRLEVAARRRIGSLGKMVASYEAQHEQRQQALDDVASTMALAMAESGVCEGPRYGRIASWIISKATDHSESEIAKIAYAHCSNDNMHGLQYRLRKDIASALDTIPTVTKR